MGPPSYMRSVVDRNVVMRRMTVFLLLVSITPIMYYAKLCIQIKSLATLLKSTEFTQQQTHYLLAWLKVLNLH